MPAMGPKERAARRALELVREGMVVGLGTGSTAGQFVQLLGSQVREGLEIIGIPTSDATERLAQEAGIPLGRLEEHPRVDLTIDGADEVDPKLDLIKGLGGALIREKIVAAASREFVVIIEGSKLVEQLGTRTPLPVEVVPSGWRSTAERLRGLGLEGQLRGGSATPYRSDNGNFILDCRGPQGDALKALAEPIAALLGVVGHGLFLGMAHRVLIGTATGVQELVRRPATSRAP